MPSYWVPPPALYPLFVVFGAAATVCTWSVFRQLKSNPDVHLTYAHRSDGAAEEGTTLKRAKEYYNSIFRQAYHLRAEGLDRPDTRIFR
ncbi:hypothetical protein CHLNCDRAFT_133067 [Chlorella variabilis]|uniref:Uncharacterized protein n=1 Tax=Chlorella variabilis TaxID=554065 RepID=E1Z2A0_CHLVA|nr:hypothetical protein CHLNCDRAFT_133067 [Chlorella variabilis]EFN59624.1 hypothetical protein CHLNCDRAFT_133067 [Chlorella variabilis]|eukprot:XP_005851726.1 hypothetical protein CHLNCDRAFT_133067 [Chlorella variabilis]